MIYTKGHSAFQETSIQKLWTCNVKHIAWSVYTFSNNPRTDVNLQHSVVGYAKSPIMAVNGDDNTVGTLEARPPAKAHTHISIYKYIQYI